MTKILETNLEQQVLKFYQEDLEIVEQQNLIKQNNATIIQFY